jgi:hypothetical protein
MHTNTITIILIEINVKTNECFISHNNPPNYFLKYGKTAKFRNFGSKLYFIAEKPHLIESNDQIRSDPPLELLCTGEQREIEKIVTIASSLQGKGGDLCRPVHTGNGW